MSAKQKKIAKGKVTPAKKKKTVNGSQGEKGQVPPWNDLSGLTTELLAMFQEQAVAMGAKSKKKAEKTSGYGFDVGKWAEEHGLTKDTMNNLREQDLLSKH